MIKDKIEEKLKTEISSRFVEVINESPNHNVPDGAESVSYTHLRAHET